MKSDIHYFRSDCWQWPEDIGKIKTKKDIISDAENLLISGSKNSNFRVEHIEVFDFVMPS
jgi:hypothetical protein